MVTSRDLLCESYRYDFFSIFTICMDEGFDENQCEFIMAI